MSNVPPYPKLETPRGSSDFGFMSSRSYMLTSCSEWGMITLHYFGDVDRGPKTRAHLMLPPLQPGFRVSKFSTHSGPFTAHPSPGRPFATSRDSRVHFFSVEYGYGQWASRFYLFVHNHTLISYLTGVGERVEWDAWGPTHTHFREQFVTLNWLRSVTIYHRSHNIHASLDLSKDNV